MPGHFSHCQIKIIVGDEINVAGFEECMISGVYFFRVLEYADRIGIPIIAEREREPEHQRDRQYQVPGQRSSVTHEFAITCLKNGVDSFQHCRYARKV